jgi:hypothetical protein
MKSWRHRTTLLTPQQRELLGMADHNIIIVGHVRTYLPPFYVRGAHPWWLRWCRPLSGPSLLSKSSSDPPGSGKVEPPPGGSSEVGPTLEGSGEPETLSVGPDWAATMLSIVPDGLRLMSFNSYLMGTLILVPDKRWLASSGSGGDFHGFKRGSVKCGYRPVVHLFRLHATSAARGAAFGSCSPDSWPPFPLSFS